MAELISISEAARELDRHPSRLRALVASGQLPGVRIGKSWAVDRSVVDRRKRARPHSGRPFEPHNAWAVLFLTSGREVGWLDAGSLWRLRNVLSLHGLAALRPRLRKRAVVHRFHAHPGQLSRLSEDRALVSSGISAASEYGLGLVAGGEVDGYVAASELDRLRREQALEAADGAEANVVLRAVPDSAWHLEEAGESAPLAVVALDLAEDPDPRSARAGAQALRDVDRELKRHLR
jgi:hypothetical protein